MADRKQGIKVVVAGGTGPVGRTIVDAIVAANKHSVVIFSRKKSSELMVKGVIIVQVDYTDHQMLVTALQGVHTVISCIDDSVESCRDAQLNLLKASIEAGVKRFAPSEWAGMNEKNITIDFYAKVKKPVADAVKRSGIEYTMFFNGLFMDYFAFPQKSNPYLPPMVLAVNINECSAWFAGTGDEPVNMTLLEDVAKFVVASLDLDKWEPYSGIVGSRTSWNEIIRLGEKVRGQKFNIKRQTIEEMLSTRNPNPTSIDDNLYQEAMVHFAQGEVEYEPTLNKRFPSIQPTKIDEFLQKWWGNKQGQVL